MQFAANRLASFSAISAALFSSLLSINSHASCGSTACSINTDWSEHGLPQAGWRADLRYSYSRAGTLKSAADKITISPTDPAYAGIEVENQRTINQILTTTLDYTSEQNWGVMLQAPYIMRDHAHLIGDPVPANVTSESFTANAMGDIKVVGRYRWNIDDAGFSSAGIKLGLKLDTGHKDFQMTDASGAPIGIPDEVTLQPGNGSTDLIVGAFWNNNTPGSDFSWFVQGTAQSAIASQASFRPGNQYNVDIGTRYAFTRDLSGLLQLNTQWNDTDSGSSAALSPITGEASSGGKSVSVTPGLSYALGSNTQLYGLWQLSVYHYVNGEQLTADSSISAGISYRF